MTEKHTTERHKPRGSWTTAEHLEYQRSGTWPLSDEYLALRDKVLADNDLEPEARPSKATDDLSADELAQLEPGDFFNRLRQKD